MLKELDISTLNEAIEVVDSMSRDPKIREMLRIREFAEHEEASRVKDALEKGIDDMSNALLAMGMDEAFVREAVLRAQQLRQ